MKKEQTKEMKIVIVPFANIRKEPSLQAEVKKVVPYGTRLTVLEAGEEFTKVSGGYIKTDLIAEK